ncbi:MAG: hypothetical protein HY903_14600 [Deltaproteobacteria bacterium]|nr:hypothetical protein [Deltaproteobacteria bacterium]
MINLQQMQLNRPGFEHGALAAARLPFIQNNDTAALQQAATALGFQSVGTDQYQHPDGSWVMMNRGRVERGYQTQHFRGLPADVTQLPALRANQVANAASAQLPQSIPNGDLAAFQGALAKAGFAQVLPCYYSHPDGSWVAIVDKNTVRGFGQNRLPNNVAQSAQSTPATDAGTTAATPPRGRARANAQPDAAPANQKTAAKGKTAGALTADAAAAFPRRPPQFSDGFLACAQLPFLNAANVAADKAMFKQKGFSEKAPGYFEHPDGSWAAYTSGGTIERGVGNNSFQRVPVGIARQQQAAPNFNQFGLAIAQAPIAKLTAAALKKSDQALLDAGFTKVHAGLYTHPDQSFVAFVEGQIYFGHANVLLSGPPTYSGMQAIAPDVNAVLQGTVLWGLPIDDQAKCRADLLARGFNEARPGYFQHGNIWVAFDDKQVICGSGQYRYQAIPAPETLPKIKPNDGHRWMAIAQTHDLKADDANLSQRLGGLGYRAAAPGFYQHQDTSWLAVSGGKLYRGVAGEVLASVPKPPDPKDVRQYTSLPSSTWDWYKANTALGRVPPIGNNAGSRQTLQGMGFQAVSSGGTERWQHLDGSWVEFYGGGRMDLGWQKWRLGQLPYNNRTSG